MSDSPVPETLETIAAKIEALSRSNDERFGRVDRHFARMNQQFAKVDQQFAKVDERFVTIDQQFAKVDQQFAETRAQLGVKIEAVDTKVDRVYDAVLALQGHAETNVADHKRFTERLDNHDVRILALESRWRSKR